MSREQILTADLVWTGEAFEPDIKIRLDADGRIAAIGRLDAEPSLRLTGRALLPGMVNAHSHAFQRGLRGRGETFPSGAGSFWTWREAMYELVKTCDRDAFYELCLQAFREMLACGITTVGEFHYFHHESAADDSAADDYAFDELVLRAAAEVGIRIVLLQAYYATGGIGTPLNAAQKRFRSTSPQRYWQQLDHLAAVLEPATQKLGVVVHSLRAAPLDDLVALHRGARERGLVFHIHIEEQRREIEACLAAYGQRPMEILNERLEVTSGLTAVHCTHSAPEDLDRFLAAGGNVCICPLTEANLGDGIADVPSMLEPNGQLCLGTDSNARLSMAEEMRWLEYVQRLHREKRGVCHNKRGEVGRRLFAIATHGGARALDVDAGSLAVGAWGDFFTLDLDAPSLAGWTTSTLLDAFVFGARDEVVCEVCVGGRWVES